jgi:hypothetical protein
MELNLACTSPSARQRYLTASLANETAIVGTEYAEYIEFCGAVTTSEPGCCRIVFVFCHYSITIVGSGRLEDQIQQKCMVPNRKREKRIILIIDSFMLIVEEVFVSKQVLCYPNRTQCMRRVDCQMANE